MDQSPPYSITAPTVSISSTIHKHFIEARFSHILSKHKNQIDRAALPCPWEMENNTEMIDLYHFITPVFVSSMKWHGHYFLYTLLQIYSYRRCVQYFIFCVHAYMLGGCTNDIYTLLKYWQLQIQRIYLQFSSVPRIYFLVDVGHCARTISILCVDHHHCFHFVSRRQHKKHNIDRILVVRWWWWWCVYAIYFVMRRIVHFSLYNITKQ